MQKVYTCTSSSFYGASNLQSEVFNVNELLCQDNGRL